MCGGGTRQHLPEKPLTGVAPSYFIQSFLFTIMKVVSSIRTLKHRHPNCQVVRRRGRVYVINKTNPRFKARQG